MLGWNTVSAALKWPRRSMYADNMQIHVSNRIVCLQLNTKENQNNRVLFFCHPFASRIFNDNNKQPLSELQYHKTVRVGNSHKTHTTETWSNQETWSEHHPVQSGSNIPVRWWKAEDSPGNRKKWVKTRWVPTRCERKNTIWDITIQILQTRSWRLWYHIQHFI